MSCNPENKASLGNSGECPECEFEPLVRNHFFTGKMMGTGEFITETAYHAERMRHHNARLHGWGVVCGLTVHQHENPQCQKRFVNVDPGSALDCCGHEILVIEPEVVDVTSFTAVKKLAQNTTAALSRHTSSDTEVLLPQASA